MFILSTTNVDKSQPGWQPCVQRPQQCFITPPLDGSQRLPTTYVAKGGHNIELRTRPESEPGRQYCGTHDSATIQTSLWRCAPAICYSSPIYNYYIVRCFINFILGGHLLHRFYSARPMACGWICRLHCDAFSFIYSYSPQQYLYFLPLPHGHG